MELFSIDIVMSEAKIFSQKQRDLLKKFVFAQDDKIVFLGGNEMINMPSIKTKEITPCH